MKKVLKYNGKVITLTPYNTLQERDILLYTSGEYDFDALMEIVENNIKIKEPYTYESLSDAEKMYILLELKHASVGEVFSFIKKCDSCSENYEADVTFENVLNEGCLENYENIELTEAFSDDYNDYVDFEIDELDIDVYDKLIEHIDKYKTKFNFSTSSVCTHCKAQNKIILTKKHLVENLSEDTLSNFYHTISSMVYHGNYTKKDIDSMLPFERSIYLSLLNEEISKSDTGGM
jgi:hypothetical protein